MLWHGNWRDELWAKLGHPWDMIIVGGGVVGAGILREAARLRLRALLVEQRDFSWGTSSRSSKLVHGGLRYLKTGDVRLTWESVHERQRLLKDGPGLIEPISCLLANFRGEFAAIYSLGLAVYDLMALRWAHCHYNREQVRMLAPHLAMERLTGGYGCGDGQTDDSRLVLRVLQEALADGGTAAALNYVKACQLLREGERVVGVRLHDAIGRREADVRAKVVINATGAWADDLRQQMGQPKKMRPLRGSHLMFPAWRFPVAQMISFSHPADGRPVFVLPWEGATLVGTTDVDHPGSLDDEPRISPDEFAYLMAAVSHTFPTLNLTPADVISTWAGVRPVIDTGKADPSKEARDHAIWYENGLLTITGGKLTTFRVMAQDALRAIPRSVLALPRFRAGTPALDPVEMDASELRALPHAMRRRLTGRYGAAARALVTAAAQDELTEIPGTNILWAELRWAARSEAVMHLDDLLLRRVRLGLIAPEGGAAFLPRIRQICQPELGWDDARWEAEEDAYRQLWRSSYSLPAVIPNLRTAPPPAQAIEEGEKMGRWMLLALLGGVALLAVIVLTRTRRRRQITRDVHPRHR